MEASTISELLSDTMGDRPLALPEELWRIMSAENRRACVAAQALIGGFGEDRSLDIAEMTSRAGLSVPQALEGLSVLDGMDLVRIESSNEGPQVTLLAIPDEHVRIVGPDGRERWVFVARPLDAPALEPSELN